MAEHMAICTYSQRKRFVVLAELCIVSGARIKTKRVVRGVLVEGNILTHAWLRIKTYPLFTQLVLVF
jgi:hypothetical protein